MPIANGGFEQAGSGAGQAASWTLTSVVTTEEIAAFDTVPEPYEDFEEGWGNDGFIFHIEDDDLDQADFGNELGRNAEGFEAGWSNDGYLFHLGSAGTANFTGGVPKEDFLGRSATDGSTNLAGTELTSVAIAFTAADVGKYVHSITQPIAQITAVAGNTATITPAWAGNQANASFDLIEWNEVLPAF